MTDAAMTDFEPLSMRMVTYSADVIVRDPTPAELASEPDWEEPAPAPDKGFPSQREPRVTPEESSTGVVGREFDPNEPRDDHGRWAMEGYVSAVDLIEARTRAVEKYRNCPAPTATEIEQNLRLIERYGHAEAESRQRGNSTTRRTNGQKLLREFGDGNTAPCIYCGAKLTMSTLQRDRLYTANEGGRYRFANLVPADGVCNRQRGSMPFSDLVSKLEVQ